MTCIAYKDGILAADRLTILGGHPMATAKIWVVDILGPPCVDIIVNCLHCNTTFFSPFTTKFCMYCGKPISNLGHLPLASERFLFGTSGTAYYEGVFLEWYKGGCPDKKPEIEKYDFKAMVIKGGRIFWYDHTLLPFEVTLPFFAIGSGAELAIGAMAAGKSAREAVEIACEHDINCGMGVDVLEVNPSPFILCNCPLDVRGSTLGGKTCQVCGKDKWGDHAKKA